MDIDITTSAPGADLRRQVAQRLIGSRASRWAPGSLAWAEVIVRPQDQGVARAFYGALLGWSFADLSTDELRGYALACVGEASPENQVGGMDARPGQGDPVPRWQPIIASGDVDGAVRRAVQLGATVVMEPRGTLGGGRKAILRDGAGAIFGLWDLGGHGGAGRFDAPGAVVWAERRGRGSEAATALHEAALGTRYEVLPAAGSASYRVAVLPHRGGAPSISLTTPEPGAPIATARGARMSAAGRAQSPLVRHGIAPVPGSILSPSAVPVDAHEAASDLAHHGVAHDPDGRGGDAHWIAYFGATDVRASARLAEDLGAQVVRAPWRSAFGRVVHLRDPLGVTFGLIERR